MERERLTKEIERLKAVEVVAVKGEEKELTAVDAVSAAEPAAEAKETPVVDAGEDIAGLIDYLNKNGFRYNGLPAKFIWHR